MCSGSKTLVEQETFLENRLRHTHNYTCRGFPWRQFRKYLKKMPSLEKFENSESQNKRNRNKYSLADTLIDKLSGHANSPARGSARSAFLQKRFPKSFYFTWASLLNSENWTRLDENQNNTDSLAGRMKKLIIKFTGNNDPTE